jgi:hypothetical protein
MSSRARGLRCLAAVTRARRTTHRSVAVSPGHVTRGRQAGSQVLLSSCPSSAFPLLTAAPAVSQGQANQRASGGASLWGRARNNTTPQPNQDPSSQKARHRYSSFLVPFTMPPTSVNITTRATRSATCQSLPIASGPRPLFFADGKCADHRRARSRCLSVLLQVVASA